MTKTSCRTHAYRQAGCFVASPRIAKADGLARDELGFLRARGYGATKVSDIRRTLGAGAEDEVLHLHAGGGKRVETLSSSGDGIINVAPGDRLVSSPRITKASLSPEMRREIAGLGAVGLGYAEIVPTPKGAHDVRVRLRGVALASGVRTDALVLLPTDFPAIPPIGFYVRAGAFHNLDRDHLFEQRAFHGAPDLSNESEKWQWFCAVPDSWKPGKHSLAGWVLAALAFLNGAR